MVPATLEWCKWRSANAPMIAQGFSQGIAKDVLFIVSAHNVGTDVGLASQNVTKAIEVFDKHLNQLINGDANTSTLRVANMSVLVQSAVTALVEVWVPFKELIGNHSNVIVGANVLKQFASESNELLSATENVVDKPVTTSSAAGGAVEPVVVTTVRRQTMLMHKMTKEVLMIGLGIEVEQNPIRLQPTATTQVNGANRGLILGAP